MRKYIRLNEVFDRDSYGTSGVTHEGIFTSLFESPETTPIPFTESESATLDELLPWNYGERIVTPFVLAHCDEDGKILEDSPEMQKLAVDVWNMYHVKWEHLYAIYEAEYNPISNYDMVESEQTEAETESVVEGQSERDGSTTASDNLNTYGFNSSSAVPRDANSGGGTNHDEETDGQETTGSAVGTRNLTRSGNIGVTTTQQMMNQEIELWKWNLLNQVLDDVANFLTLKIF